MSTIEHWMYFSQIFFIRPGLYSNHLGAGGILGLQYYYKSSIVFLIIEKKLHSLFSYLGAIIFYQGFTKTYFFTKNENWTIKHSETQPRSEFEIQKNENKCHRRIQNPVKHLRWSVLRK